MSLLIFGIREKQLPRNSEVGFRNPLLLFYSRSRTHSAHDHMSDSRAHCFQIGNMWDLSRVQDIFKSAQTRLWGLYKHRHIARLVFVTQHFHMGGWQIIPFKNLRHAWVKTAF